MFCTLSSNTIEATKSYHPDDVIGMTIDDISSDVGFKEVLKDVLQETKTKIPLTQGHADIISALENLHITKAKYNTKINNLKSIEGIQYFTKLKYLNIDNTQLEIFPNQIFELATIENLRFHNNRKLDLSTMADRFDDIPTLKTLQLLSFSTDIRFELPQSFYRHQGLQTINFDKIYLDGFDSIPNAKEIRTFNFAGSDLTKLPKNITEVKGEINLAENNFVDISPVEYHFFGEDSNVYRNIHGQKKYFIIQNESLTSPLKLSNLSIFNTIDHIIDHDNADVEVQFMIATNRVVKTISYDEIYDGNGITLPVEYMGDITTLIQENPNERVSVRVLVNDGPLYESRYTFEINHQVIDKDEVLFNTDTKEEIKRVTLSNQLGETTEYKSENFDHLQLENEIDVHNIVFRDNSDYVIKYKYKTYDVQFDLMDEQGNHIGEPIIINGKYSDAFKFEIPVIDGYKAVADVHFLEGIFDGETSNIKVVYIADSETSNPDEELPGIGNPFPGLPDEEVDAEEPDTPNSGEDLGEVNRPNLEEDNDFELSEDTDLDQKEDVETGGSDNDSNKDVSNVLPSTGIASNLFIPMTLIILGFIVVLIGHRKLGQNK